MNALTKWNPFREMEDMQRSFATLFDRWAPLGSNGGRDELTFSQWAPLVDISEDDREYLIRAELPGVRREDLSVTVENGVLTIRGERKYDAEQKGVRYHRIERAYGSFVRTFTLPDDADDAKVHAEFKDGVLTVHLAKAERARPKYIEIQS